jgi:hypothetical protein
MVSDLASAKSKGGGLTVMKQRISEVFFISKRLLIIKYIGSRENNLRLTLLNPTCLAHRDNTHRHCP